MIFRKEWREFVRDRRTLFLTCVMPLVFYPAAMAVFGYLGAKQERSLREAELRVGIVGGELRDLWESGEFNATVTSYPTLGLGEADLSAGKLDSLVTGTPTRTGWDVVVYGWGTAEGEIVQKRMRAHLGALEARLVQAGLAGAGVDPALVKPLTVVEVDRAPVREAAGSKVGGVVAYFLLFLAFTGCLATAVDVLAGEKERGTLEAVLATPVDVRVLLLAKLGFVTLTGMLAAVCSLAGLVIFSLLGGGAEVRAGVEGILGLGTLVAVFSLVLVATLLFAAVMLSFSLVARTAREAQGWTSPVFLGVSLVLIYAMLPGVSADGPLRWVPLVNLSLALRDALAGTLTAGLLSIVLLETLGLAALVSWLGGRLGRSEAVLFRAS
jgi:sodium transport system permease protein